MPKEPAHRHNGGPLSDDDRRKLWDHVRAREALNEQMEEVRLDVAARKELIKADGFDVNMVELILKRRKNGEGETAVADSIVRIYEEGLRDQGALPLERTRQTPPPARRPIADIARELHGEELPDMPERPDIAEYKRVKLFVVEAQRASTSQLQRVFEIGYNAAARHMEQLERDGIVSRPDAVGARTVLVRTEPDPGQDAGTSLIDPF